MAGRFIVGKSFFSDSLYIEKISVSFTEWTLMGVERRRIVRSDKMNLKSYFKKLFSIFSKMPVTL
jgi:hypothetical protein